MFLRLQMGNNSYDGWLWNTIAILHFIRYKNKEVGQERGWNTWSLQDAPD